MCLLQAYTTVVMKGPKFKQDCSENNKIICRNKKGCSLPWSEDLSSEFQFNNLCATMSKGRKTEDVYLLCICYNDDNKYWVLTNLTTISMPNGSNFKNLWWPNTQQGFFTEPNSGLANANTANNDLLILVHSKHTPRKIQNNKIITVAIIK